jgi:hypothetical protein
MSLTKKQIIEKLKSIQYEVDSIFNERLDKFDFELLEFRKDLEPDYGYISHLGHEVYEAQRVQKVILEIIGEEDGD